MSVVYLTVLLASSGCMVLVDRRFRLFFWHRPVQAAIVLASGLVFFLAWDLLGIGLGIFARGRSAFMTGWEFAPQLPIEEPLFLAFLCYLAMVVFTSGRRLTRHRGASR